MAQAASRARCDKTASTQGIKMWEELLQHLDPKEESGSSSSSKSSSSSPEPAPAPPAAAAAAPAAIFCGPADHGRALPASAVMGGAAGATSATTTACLALLT